VAGTAVWLCVLGAFAAATIVYAADFRDPLTFWQSGVRTSPHSAFAHKNLGVIRYLHGDPSGAERHYRRALKLRPGEPMVRNNLGLLCLEQGRLAEAEALFREELELYPRYEKPYFNLARLYDRQGNAAAAEHWRARAARIARGE
jgi:Flp pilus assembly protein TadD